MDGAEGAGQNVEAGLLDELVGLLGVGVDGLGDVVVLVADAVLTGTHAAELALKAAVKAGAHVGRTLGVLNVDLIGLHGAVVHGTGEAHLQGTAHVGEVLAVIEVHADHGAGALGQGNHGRAHGVERRKGVVALGVGENDRIAGLLGGVQGGAGGLEAGHVERGDGHVLLLGDGADVSEVDDHLVSLLDTLIDGDQPKAARSAYLRDFFFLPPLICLYSVLVRRAWTRRESGSTALSISMRREASSSPSS